MKETLDTVSSGRANPVGVGSARGSSALVPQSGGRLTRYFPIRVPFLTLPQEGERSWRFPWGWASFVALVALPAAATVIYLAFFASNQYVAEMRLVVRMGRTSGPSGGFSGSFDGLTGGSGGGASASGGKLGGAIASMSSTDGGADNGNAHIVSSYIQSRAIVDELLRVLDLRQIYTRPEADFYARLPEKAPIEDLTEYWRSMVRAGLDPLSGIVTVTVRAFRPDDAVAVSHQIERLSEKLVNDISARARADTLRRATEEVQRAQGVLLASLREMEKFRNREGLIDPVESAKQTTSLLTKVLGDQLETENQLFIAGKSLSQDSASVRQLRIRAENLKKQVAAIRAQMAGDDRQSANYAGALARYEEVAVQQKLAQTLYTMAENDLERARITAEAQSVYLSVFVKPTVPEDSTYPKRFQMSALLIACFTVAWGILALIGASVQDHRAG